MSEDRVIQEVKEPRLEGQAAHEAVLSAAFCRDAATQSAGAPPRIGSSSPVTPWVLLLVSTAVLVGLLLLYFFDPARHALYPQCTFKKATGYDCPGCGGLRALHQLLRGDVEGAFQLNAMVVSVLPVTVGWLALRWRKPSRGRALSHRQITVLAVVLVLGLVLFGLVRNLPLWPFGVTPG